MAGSRPEHHRQNQVGRSHGHQQHSGVHIRVKNTVAHRDPAARQQPQRQHAARHGAGYGEQQQHQAQQLFLPAESDQCQQDSHCQFGRKGAQKAHSRQKDRHGVNSAQGGGQQIPSPLQRDARQPCGHQKQNVIHGSVQEEHTVRVYHRHPAPPFRSTGSIIMRTDQRQGFQGHLALFECKVFGLNCLKTLHLPLVRRSAPVEIRIVTMAEFHKSGLSEPFLWNCAATAVRINRKAVYSVDIIIGQAVRKYRRKKEMDGAWPSIHFTYQI